MDVNPTTQTYSTFESAYAHFNMELFGGQLPACLITVKRQQGTPAYFSSGRFSKVGSRGELTDEIAMNPAHFARRPIRETLSSLAHEMVHLWQHHFGKAPRRCYHNKEWAAKMKDVGLVPRPYRQTGGKGNGAGHKPLRQGRRPLRPRLRWIAQPEPRHSLSRPRRRRLCEEGAKQMTASKTKYTCNGCAAHAWGKPNLCLLCGNCLEPMMAEGAAHGRCGSSRS